MNRTDFFSPVPEYRDQMMVQHPPGEDVLEIVLIGSQKYQASALSLHLPEGDTE